MDTLGLHHLGAFSDVFPDAFIGCLVMKNPQINLSDDRPHARCVSANIKHLQSILSECYDVNIVIKKRNNRNSHRLRGSPVNPLFNKTVSPDHI
jgi:hypothetical protein